MKYEKPMVLERPKPDLRYSDAAPVNGIRFQVIGLTRELRSRFLSCCKLNNKSGTDVIKDFMQDYIDEHERE